MLCAELVVVGSELLSPLKADTNSLWLTEQLESLGIEVHSKTVVGDDPKLLTETFAAAIRRADIVLSTGGLGPTADDLTRDAFAKAAGLSLELRKELVDEIRAKFERRGRQMAENNARQAMLPPEALALENPTGTAPGIYLEVDGTQVALLPGPPRELKPMFSDHVQPKLQSKVGEFRTVRRCLHVTAMGESDMDQKIAPLYTATQNPTTTVNFTATDIEIHLTARAKTVAEAEGLNRDMAEKMASALGEKCYTLEGEGLELVCVRRLRERELTVATAESLTGGMVGERLTRVPGSSAVFLGGMVTYTNAMKTSLLGVDPDLLEEFGAVSKETAEAMAQAVQQKTGASFGLATTGVAGPSGGSSENPVGTVYVAIAGPDRVFHRRLSLPGDRQLIRMRAGQGILFLLYKHYLNDRD